jgi:hypothetical protein
MTNPQEGVGLGLALVKSFCDLHDATMSIQSALGTGTVVVLGFPYPGGCRTDGLVPSILGRRMHEGRRPDPRLSAA